MQVHDSECFQTTESCDLQPAKGAQQWPMPPVVKANHMASMLQ